MPGGGAVSADALPHPCVQHAGHHVVLSSLVAKLCLCTRIFSNRLVHGGCSDRRSDNEPKTTTEALRH